MPQALEKRGGWGVQQACIIILMIDTALQQLVQRLCCHAL